MIVTLVALATLAVGGSMGGAPSETQVSACDETPFAYTYGRLHLQRPYVDCEDEAQLNAQRRYTMLRSPSYDRYDAFYLGIVVERDPYTLPSDHYETPFGPTFLVTVHRTVGPWSDDGSTGDQLRLTRSVQALQMKISPERFERFELALDSDTFIAAAAREVHREVWMSHQPFFSFDFQRGEDRHIAVLYGNESFRYGDALSTGQAFLDLATELFPELRQDNDGTIRAYFTEPMADETDAFTPLLPPSD